MRYAVPALALAVSVAACGGSGSTTQSSGYACAAGVGCECMLFTYGDWSSCSPGGQQTRIVSSASPPGCTGGSPVLTQGCNASRLTCTSFTYTDWSVCYPDGQQTRAVSSATPVGCAGGSPVVTQACTPTPAPSGLQARTAISAAQTVTTGTIVFQNDTSMSVNELYLVPAGTDGWGPVQNSAPVPPGGTFSFAGIPAGTYDAQAVVRDAASPYVAYALGLTASADETTWKMSDPTRETGSLEVTNGNARYSLVEVNVAPVGAASWGANLASSPVLPGNDLVYGAAPGEYGLRCAQSSGAVSMGAYVVPPRAYTSVTCY